MTKHIYVCLFVCFVEIRVKLGRETSTQTNNNRITNYDCEFNCECIRQDKLIPIRINYRFSRDGGMGARHGVDNVQQQKGIERSLNKECWKLVLEY